MSREFLTDPLVDERGNRLPDVGTARVASAIRTADDERWYAEQMPGYDPDRRIKELQARADAVAAARPDLGDAFPFAGPARIAAAMKAAAELDTDGGQSA